MANDIAKLDEVRTRLMNIYEKLTEVNITRDFLQKEMHTTEMADIKNNLKPKKSEQTEYEVKCSCETKVGKGISGVYVGQKSGTKALNCYNCVKQYLPCDKIEFANEKVDYLGWGLSGLFEQDSSEESSGSTSSNETVVFERKCMYSRQKILRKLRRKKPEAFELNYVEMNVSDILKAEIDDPELRRAIKKVRGINDKDFEKQTIKTIRQKVPLSKEYDHGGSHFDFSAEIHLKEKYSSTKFDFLTGLIHYYQKFLKKHPEERYPSVSELMIKSGQNICKDEEEVVSRYYDVLYKKGGPKKLIEPIQSENIRSASVTVKTNNTEIQDMRATQSNYESYNPTITPDAIPHDEVLRAKRTGVLDLSSKSMMQVPTSVWSIDHDPLERKRSLVEGQSIRSLPKRNKMVKPLIYLNLSHNKLRKLYPRGNCFETLLHLCLGNNKIEELPDEFGLFKTLQFLDLENNALRYLPKSFCKLTSLKDVNLRRNCLIELPNSFGSLKKLKSIDLRWNRLSKLPDTIEDLESLNNLNIAYNRITALTMDLCNLYSLIILDVSYNKISEVPLLVDMPKLLLVNAMGNFIKEFPNFANCKSLCEIRLDGNRLQSIPTDHLRDCPVVQLTLSHNKVKYIPDDIFKIETLVLLDLTYNRLSELPASLGRLKYLTCIRVDENHIMNIDKDILNGGSKKILAELLRKLLSYEGDNDTIVKARNDLEILFVKSEKSTGSLTNKNMTLDRQEVAKTGSFIRKRMELTTLPSEWIKVAEEYNVSTVDISKNKFRYIPAGLRVLGHTLKELIMRENNLKTVPDFIGRMPQLIILDVSFNHLDNLPLSMTTCRLTKLVCRRNVFTAIPKVVFMIQTIEHLDFSENMIKEIDVDGLRNLRKLYYLNVSKNEIRRLPSELGYLVNIRQLDVTDNNFKRPGLHIIRGGTQVLMEYLKRHPSI